MKFSYSWLKELAGFKETPEQLAEFLNMRAFEVDSIEKTGNDRTLDIKLPANRYADASGHWGMAREIAVLKSSKLKAKSSKPQLKAQKLSKNLLKIIVENSDDCPRYTAIVMTNIKVGESPEWIKERLETCGLQSINNLVDAANYVMLETGQPLHVFDYGKINGKMIIARRAKKGEKLAGLDDKIYELNPKILVIADEKEPIAIAGIKGGKESGISDKTSAIVLESANFAPAVIHQTSQTLNLKTDASIRFEHDLDPNQTETAIDRLASLVAELIQGKIVNKIDTYPKPQKALKIFFRPPYANDLLGETLSAANYFQLFKQLGFPIKQKKNDFIVEVPTYRLDLTMEEDLIEEIGRLYGYENIRPQMPQTILLPPQKNDEWLWENGIKKILAGAGFTESLLYEFTGDRELDNFFTKKDNLVELENPASPETKYLVPEILIKYAASAAVNLRDFDSVKIFGIEKSFSIAVSGLIEHKDLIILFAKKGSSGEDEFYQLKGVLDLLMESLGISDFWYDDAVNRQQTHRDKFHPYRFAEIKIGDEKIGSFGEIHPEVLKNIKAKARIVAAEINFGKLWKLARAETEYKPVSKFPAVIRDIAVVVSLEIKTEEIQNIIENTGGELLLDVDLFDYFQDERMREEEGKSLAFHLVFQSPERTLKDKEVDERVQKVIKALEENGWEVRK